MTKADPLYQRFEAQALGQELAGWARCQRIAIEPELLETTDYQNALIGHDRAMAQWSTVTAASPRCTPNLLDLKRHLSELLMSPCRQCWLDCQVDRRNGDLGFCQLGPELRVYNDFLHYGEEPDVSPSYTVFLAGCSFRCVFCSDDSHVRQPRQHPPVDTASLAQRIGQARRDGALSLSFVGGSPDVNISGILGLLTELEESIPVVWNSNMSLSAESEHVLEGVIDASLADLKFGQDRCAQRLAGLTNHNKRLRPQLMRAARNHFTIVRHLVMPGHIDCCAKPCLEWLAEVLPGARVNLMDQYLAGPSVFDRPQWAQSELAQSLDKAEFQALWAWAQRLPLKLDAWRERPRKNLQKSPESLDSKITITADGELIIENLSGSLLDLANELARIDHEIDKRNRET